MELLRLLRRTNLLLRVLCSAFIVVALVRMLRCTDTDDVDKNGALARELSVRRRQSRPWQRVDAAAAAEWPHVHKPSVRVRSASAGDADATTSRPWKSLDETMGEVLELVDDEAMAAGRALQGLRVCFVAAGLAGPIPFGGLGQAVLRQAALYAEQGALVDIAYTGRLQCAPPCNHTYFKEEYRRLGIDYIPVPRSAPGDAYGTEYMQRAYDLYLWMRGRQAQDGVEYDLVVLHDLQALGLYVQHARRAGSAFANRSMAIMSHAHGSSRLSDYFNARMPVKGDSGLVTYAMERLSTEMADFVISPSEFYYAWMQQKAGYDLSPEHALVRRWTIHLLMPRENSNSGPRVFNNKARYGHRVMSRKFAYFGRFDRLKGIFTLLDALDDLVALSSTIGRDALPDEVLFLGDSTMLNVDGSPINAVTYIRNRATSGGWPFPVKVVEGLNSVQAVRKFVMEDYIVVNPTNGEVSSTVTLELVSGGVATILSNACAISELVGDKEMFREWSFGRG
eukprot:Opistho-1_new@91925